MIAWSAVENALHAWLDAAMAAVGVDADRILWSDQDAPRGEGAYLTVRRGDLVPVSNPMTQLVDHSEDVPPPAAGQEFEHRTEVTMALTVSLQAFDSRMVGDTTGVALLHEAIMHLGLPTIRDALHAAGLFCFDRGGIRNVSELVGADFESRAVADVRFYLNDVRSEFTGYIASVELTPNVDGEDLPTQTLSVPEE